MKGIDEHIQRAMEEGKFDNLPGKGKPINLDENPHEDPEWSTAYRMLRSSGFTLPWIESRQEIETRLSRARQNLERAWLWRSEALDRDVPRAEIEPEWERALSAFRLQITEINDLIKSYNLEAPSSTFQRVILDVDAEVQRITGA